MRATIQKQVAKIFLSLVLISAGFLYWYSSIYAEVERMELELAEKSLVASNDDNTNKKIVVKKRVKVTLEDRDVPKNSLDIQSPLSIEGNRLDMNVNVLEKAENPGIPKIIHRIFWNQFLVSELRPLIVECYQKNPGFQHWFWTISDIKNLIKNLYPEYRYYFFSQITQQQKLTAAKYFILNAFGGYILDLDMKCHKSFENLSAKQCIIAQENQITAAVLNHRDSSLATDFLACVPKHPFLQELMLTLYKVTSLTKIEDVDSRVGSLMLNSVLSSYKQNAESQNALLFIATSQTFNPTFDITLQNFLRFECQKPTVKNLMKIHRLCIELKTNSYANVPIGVSSYTEKMFVKRLEIELGQLVVTRGEHEDVAEWIPNLIHGSNQVAAAKRWTR